MDDKNNAGSNQDRAPRGGRNVSGPPQAFVCKIPDSLTIRQEPTASDDQRHAEEKARHYEQLRAAKHLNRITICAALVSLLGVMGLVFSLIQSRTAMEVDQRAWLAPGNYRLFYPEGGPSSFNVEITNTGKTPAQSVTTQFFSIYMPSGSSVDSKDFVYPAIAAIQQQGTVFPNQKFQASTGNMLINLAEQKARWNDVTHGRTIETFYGVVHYKDVFGKSHWTHFCIEATGNLQTPDPCPTYNDTDTNQ